MNSTAIITFACVILVVILISLYKRQKSKTTISLFFADKRLGFFSIGCALYFTNISATEFIGGSQSAYINNMSVMAWGVSSVFAMLIVSEYIIPVYLRSKMLTTPDFLEKRYDSSTKKLVSVMFLISYIANVLPIILYGGAVAVNGLFHFSDQWGFDYFSIICILIFCVALIGLIYSVTGGLKVIVVSDILLAIGLFVSGLLFLYFAFRHLGNGSFEHGIHTIVSFHQHHLNSIGNSKDAVPFYTLFTGMLIINLFYWGTEQVIVQQALAGKSLIDIQKGIALAAFGKLLGPLLFIIPGVIAVHVIPGIANSVEVFPRSVSLVTPPVITGIIGSVMFGSVVTAFSATLNSASTLFILNIYKPYKERKAKQLTEANILRTAKQFEILVCLLAICIAPLIFFVKDDFYTYIQKVSGCFSVPIFTVMICGFLTKWITPFAAKIGLFFCAAGYIITELLLKLDLHYLHVLFVLFLLTILIMAVISKLFPSKLERELKDSPPSFTPLKPWKYRYFVAGLLLLLMILMFIIFSPLGIAT
ncbi:MAG: solute:sodium symporter family transporter [Ilyomonas sp.]